MDKSANPSKYLETFKATLKKRYKDRVVILLNRYASFGRNTYGFDSWSALLLPKIILSDTEYWGKNKVAHIFSNESKTKKRYKDTQLNFKKLGKFLNPLLKKTCSAKHLIVWQNNKEIESCANNLGCKILSMSSKTSEFLEDKNNFNEILKKSKVSKEHCLKQLVFKNNKSWLTYDEIRQRLGGIFVIQSKGAGGRGTKIIRTVNEFNKAKEIFIDTVRVTEYFRGFSSNVNILTIPPALDVNGLCSIYVAIPSYKATNINEIGATEVMSAGSDWNISFPKSLNSDFIGNIELIGLHIYKKYGLIGMWGLDSIWSDSRFVFNELNCRFQGTTEVSSINQWQRGVPPFYGTHQLIFDNHVVNWMPPADEFNRETIKLMNNIKNFRPFYLKIKVKTPKAVSINDKLNGSGVYKKMPDYSLKKLNDKITTSSANFDNDEILVTNLPGEKTLCYPGSQLCTVEGITRKRNIFDGPHSLSKDGKSIVDIIYKYFNQR